jgi:hypothetical protein
MVSILKKGEIFNHFLATLSLSDEIKNRQNVLNYRVRGLKLMHFRQTFFHELMTF